MADRSHEVLAVAILFLVTSWITVSLRVYVRAGMLKTFGADDWTMVTTLLLFTAYLICQIGGVQYGTGRHAKDLSPHNKRTALRYWYLCELFYISSSCTLKIALGIFFLRFSTKRVHIWITRLLMIGTGIFGTGYFFLVMFQCTPISDYWTVSPGSARCVDTKYITGATYAASALTAIVDWTFGILPIFLVWNLQLDRKAKAYVAGILAFASIGGIATIVRIPSVSGLDNSADYLWSTTDLAIWSTVEPGIGITAGCLATLRPLLQTLLWRVGLSSSAPSAAQQIGGRGRSNRQSRFGHHRGSHWLADLRPDNVGTVTSVTGPSRASRRDRSSSTERMMLSTGGITKEVVVEYTSEAGTI